MSFNICLDTLPAEYEGYLIRTDFRIGMQISLAMSDPDLDQQEQFQTAISLLYGRGIPDLKTALEGLSWFMRCGQDVRKDLPKDDKQVVFYDFDSGRIWASFKATFGIDLYREKMHWFEFCHLLSCCGEDTSISNAMKIRQYSTKGLKGEELSKLAAAKRALQPPERLSEQQKEQDNDFISQMKQIGEVQHGTG